MPKYDRKILLAISDMHAGHKVGLCSPYTVLEDIESGEVRKFNPELGAFETEVVEEKIKYNPTLNEPQKLSWEIFDWGIKEAFKVADKSEVMVLHDGDPIQGSCPMFQRMTSRLSDQVLIALANFEPIMSHDNVKYVRFGVGSSIHELGEGTASFIVAEALRAKYPKKDIKTVYHGLTTYGGIDIDFAHVGAPPGSRAWLEGNELRYYLRSIMMKEIMAGHKPPDIIFRGHYHIYKREFLEINVNGNVHGSWIVMLPGWMYKDDYVRRSTRSDYKQTFGVIAVEIINGQIYQTHKFTQTLDLRTKETIL